MSVQKIKLKSRVLGIPLDVSVLMPYKPENVSIEEFYGSGEKYKVVWLLHGGGGTHTDWLYNGDLPQVMFGRKAIVVTPTAINTGYASHPQFAGGFDYPEFFFEELMPFIHGMYPASDKREDNFIAGLSMGGIGTLLLGMMHPEKFAGMAPLSAPIRNYEHLRPIAGMKASQWRKSAAGGSITIEGKEYPVSVNDLNAVGKYRTVGDYLASPEYLRARFMEKYAQLPPMYFACGMEDTFYPDALEFERMAREVGANIKFEFLPGYEHTWDFWKIELPRLLDFFGICRE